MTRILLILLGLCTAIALPARAQLIPLKLDPCGADVFFLAWPAQRWPPSETYIVQVFRVNPPSLAAPSGSVGQIAEGPGEVILDGALLRVKLPAPLPPGAALRAVVAIPGKGFGTVDFSTQPGAKIQRSPLDASPGRFLVSSDTPVGATPDGPLDLIEDKVLHHAVAVVRPLPEPACTQPERRRNFKIDLSPGEAVRSSGASLQLEGFRDVYASEVTATGDLKAAKVPQGKEDAVAFGSLYFEDSQGSPQAFAADLKVKPQFSLIGAWLFRPELTASVSKNLPQASNSIRLAPLFSRTDLLRKGPLVGSTFWFGPTIESDRGFDRVNGLVTLRWEPALAYLYLPREKRRFVRAVERDLKVDGVDPPLLGWGLEGWIGVEAGGSLSQQTVGALEIDRYDVLRLRPLLHGFLEIGPVTFDVSSTLRYLFSDELSYEEKPDRTLALRTVKGSRPYTEATLAVAFDPAKHLNLALTYKKGSEPPLFRQVDKLSAGIVAKY